MIFLKLYAAIGLIMAYLFMFVLGLLGLFSKKVKYSETTAIMMTVIGVFGVLVTMLALL